MKVFVAFAALLAIAYAAQDPKDATITHYESDNIGVDGYKFQVETSDGKSAQESGQLKNVGTDAEAISVQGSFRYVGQDGQTYEVKYTSDENGFQPQGAHLPVA